MAYSILQVDAACIVDDEQLGSKSKFWFEHEGHRWLFKEARVIPTPNGPVVTGEDWAEKAAAEIAKEIGVVAATVELAEYAGVRGSASLSFIPDGSVHLEHGNEILAGRVLGYDPGKRQKQSDHTIDNIVKAVQAMFAKTGGKYVLSKLAGYIVLDALICNTDRHHENWGLFWKVLRVDDPVDDWDHPELVKRYDVAPSFDHASSLGRELLDQKRAQAMREGRMPTYVRRGRGGIYLKSTDRFGENPLTLVQVACRTYPDYFRPAFEGLQASSLARIQGVIDEIPPERITPVGRAFAKALLQETYTTLLGFMR